MCEHPEANTGVTSAIPDLCDFKHKMRNLELIWDPGASLLSENANANGDKCKLYGLDQHVASSGEHDPIGLT